MKKTILISCLVLALTFISSNNVFAVYDKSSYETPSVVSSISLKLGSESNKIEWSIDGYSKNGFKVVWSKNQGPTYPTRSGDKYHYYDNPSYRYDSLEAFSGAGTYYVRVCEYLGGKCGLYSNEIKINLGNTSSEKETEYTDNNNENEIISETKEEIKIPAGYEKIPNIESIKYYKNIKKIGDVDLYGIKINIKIPEGKEWIKSLSDIKYFKNIEKIGDNLYGTRISTEQKLKLQKQIENLNSQIKKIQEQIQKLTEQMSSL